MLSWTYCGENRVFSFRIGYGFKYAIQEDMTFSFLSKCQSRIWYGQKIGDAF